MGREFGAPNKVTKYSWDDEMKKTAIILMGIFLTGCSVIPDMPGPIGIPGV